VILMQRLHDATIIGTIQDVRGATVSVVLREETVSGLSFVEGYGYRIGQVGSFVRVPLGYTSLFGVVSQVGAGAVPEKLLESHPFGNRWMTVQLVGEGDRRGRFLRGISQYPTISDDVHLVTDEDLRAIYGQPDASEYLQIGWVASAESIPALIDVNRLVSRHSAVVGATGSGKSTTVAALVRKLSDPLRYPAARVLMVDLHGEYAAALRDRATVFRANPADGEVKLSIPYWALTFDELVPLAFGAMEEPGRSAVMDLISDMKQDAIRRQPRDGITATTLSVDSPVPFSLRQLWFDLYRREFGTYIEDQTKPRHEWVPAYEKDASNAEVVGDAATVTPPRYRSIKDVRGDTEKIRYGDAPLNIRRQVGTLGARLRDPRLAFLFDPGKWQSTLENTIENDLDSLLEDWIGGITPVSILDLSGVPVAITNHIVGSILRVLFDAVFWSRNLAEGGRERPLLVVLEEAHAYLGKEATSVAGEAVRRIAKEGRKYGIGAMIVSQRPAEIDQTILSQCGTIIAMRLSNDTDRRHVSSAASDNLEGLFAMLPVLRVGEAIVVGEAVSLPVRAVIEPPSPEHLPDSRDPKAIVNEIASGEFESAGGWNQSKSPEDYNDVVKVWRRQNSTPRDE
jgi:DNA helicase HerA-like ATPase